MPFVVPTLAQLRARVRADIENRLGVGPLLDDSVLAVFAEVVAGQTHLLHGHLEYLARQVIPDTADSDFLVRWANLFGVIRIDATPASGDVTFTGTDGTAIPTGTVIRRSDGADYATTADATISGGSAVVNVQAELAGTAGNAPAATSLTLVSPIAGANATATVDTGLTGGVETESDASLLSRLVEVLQTPPMGGSEADYVIWAREVAEVTRVFVKGAQFGLGTVGVAIMTDNATGGPIPGAGKVAEVQAAIDLEKPVTASVTVFAPTAVNLSPTIQLVGADTADIRAAIEEALADLVLELGAPETTLPLPKIREAISNAPGEEDHVLTAPVADVTTTATQIHQVGTVTFV